MRNEIEVVIRLYELAESVLTPKSYQWKAIAKKMYEELKTIKKELKC